MPAALPFQLHSITLRVCADLGWRVMVRCPRCRAGSELWPSKLADKPYAALPLGQLLEGEYLKCRKSRAGVSCNGVLACELSVSRMDVGIFRELARWEIYDVSGARSARLMEPGLD
jgi:hypothetical protein